MSSDLVSVYESNKSYQVSFMKKHLDDAGIESVVFDHTDSSYVGLAGEIFVAKLMVNKEDELQAREILKKYNE